MGSQTFLKNQYGKETNRGTAVAATQMWAGSVTLPTDRKPKHPRDTFGLRMPSSRTEILELLADPVKLAMDGDTGAYFQGLLLLFGITLKGGVTATETTPSQQDYGWNFSPSLTAAASPDTITLESGDNDQNYEIEYLMGRTINIDWALGENAYLNASLDAFGRQVTKSTATPGLTRPTLNGINADLFQFFLNPTWATLGATEKIGLIRSGSIQIDTGNHPKPPSGQRYFNTHGEGDLLVTGSLVLEGGANAVSILDDFQSGTMRALRFLWTGPQIGTGVNHKLQIDVFAAFDEVIPMNAFANGNSLYAVTFSSVTDNLATPHGLDVNVITNRSTY